MLLFVVEPCLEVIAPVYNTKHHPYFRHYVQIYQTDRYDIAQRYRENATCLIPHDYFFIYCFISFFFIPHYSPFLCFISSWSPLGRTPEVIN